MLRPYGRGSWLGFAPWIFCLLIFVRFVKRAGVTPLEAAGLMTAFGFVLVLCLQIFVHVPDRGVPFPVSCDPRKWPRGRMKAFVRQIVLIAFLGVVLALAALWYRKEPPFQADPRHMVDAGSRVEIALETKGSGSAQHVLSLRTDTLAGPAWTEEDTAVSCIMAMPVV